MIMKYSRKVGIELWKLRALEASFLWADRYFLMLDFLDNVQIFYNVKVKRENVRYAWLITSLVLNTAYLLFMARRLRLIPDYLPLVHPHDHLEPPPFKFMKIHERYLFYVERVLTIISLLPYVDAGLAPFGFAAQLCLALSTVTLYYVHGPHKFAVTDNEIGKLYGRENTDSTFDHDHDHNKKGILVKLMWVLRFMEAGVFWVERVLLTGALIHNINTPSTRLYYQQVVGEYLPRLAQGSPVFQRLPSFHLRMSSLLHPWLHPYRSC